jgi:leader peptidase (prepilin peptidase) / N-methyltransferase
VVSWYAPVLLAPFIGSFLGVLIRRLPTGRPVILARSACDSCGRALGVGDLIPIASYIAQRGTCRICHGPIGRFHLMIELAALGIAVWAVSADADSDRIWIDCALGWTLLALAWIDWDHMHLPDVLTLPLVLLGLAVTALLDPEQVAEHAIGAILGYLAFRAVAAAYRALTARDGLGEGDAKLLAAAGAWLGWAALPSVVLIAALAGLGIAAVQRLGGRKLDRTTALPFGPCLALALWVVWLHGQSIIN